MVLLGTGRGKRDLQNSRRDHVAGPVRDQTAWTMTAYIVTVWGNRNVRAAFRPP